MRKITLEKSCILALVITLTLAITIPALADKPSWAGSQGKNGKHDKKEKNNNNNNNNKNHNNGYSQDQPRYDVNVNVHFSDQQRNVVRNYYTEQYRSGHCPPGLAKKNNGCMPPGQAKKWNVGHPLPRDVFFHDLPSEVVIRLGRPPAGHRYVRVASDILLIATGTGMIMDAIQDLNEM